MVNTSEVCFKGIISLEGYSIRLESYIGRYRTHPVVSFAVVVLSRKCCASARRQSNNAGVLSEKPNTENYECRSKKSAIYDEDSISQPLW